VSETLLDSRRERASNGAAIRFSILGPDRIAVHWGSTTEVIAWSDVITARSVKNETVIATRGRTLRVHCPLKVVVERLAALGLVQIRRGEAVNAAHVRRLVGGGRHRLLLVLDGDVCLRVGRQFQSRIRGLFGAGAQRDGAA
jgi:DNA-binding LytR/AlgR family response regulator